MRRPKIYNSELLLKTFIKKTHIYNLIEYIKSLNKYIDYLEAHIDEKDIIVTLDKGE